MAKREDSGPGKFKKIVVRECVFGPAGFLVLGHEANLVGTVHMFAHYKTRKSAEKLASDLRGKYHC